MHPARGFRWAVTIVALAASGLAAIGLSGCGTPGAPLPPSLNLPDPVNDLSAERTGDVVKLTWSMPAKNTDKLKIEDDVLVRICRRESDGPCAQAGVTLTFPPGGDGIFTETLPPALAAGPPRKLTYFVELKNKKGRSAGLSNDAETLAGQAPAAVLGLAGEVRKQGVVLHWAPNPAADTPAGSTAIRLHRKLISATPAKPQGQSSLLAPEPEPIDRTLLVESPDQPPRTIDKDIRLGQTYEYRAQRIVRIVLKDSPPSATAGANAQPAPQNQSQVLELAGPISDPIRVNAADNFPPDIPTGLAAIATKTSTESSIDLSWKPNSDKDLVGYVVYRREGDGPWQRISPAEPIVGPAFHDSHVRPGQTYRYAVTALDQAGHESPRSAEAEETAPSQ